MKAIQLATNAFLPRILGELAILHEQCHHIGLSEEESGLYFQGDVQFGTGNRGLNRTLLSDLVCELHSGEEHLSVPVEPFRTGPPHKVVISFPGVRYHL